MHCYVCDKMLSDTEVIWNKDLGEWEPCAKCLEIALDAAYTGGFKAAGMDQEEEEILGDADVEELLADWDEMGDLPWDPPLRNYSLDKEE